ncbi:hypothetical protein MTO96_008992 [Rhipicephalus appendiculatus]
MDASAFYGCSAIERHGKTRRKASVSAAEQIFLAIADGNLSDANLSDDEAEDADDVVNVDTDLGGPSKDFAPADEGSSDSDEGCDAVEKKRKKAVKWVKKSFNPGDISWIANPKENQVPAEPLQYFMKYIPDSTFERLAECSNLYYLRTTGSELSTTPQEIRVFIGIMMYMAVLKFPRIRMYWQQRTRIAVIADAMNLNRFFKLRTAVHITDASGPGPNNTDKFWKVRPLVDVVRERCLQLHVMEQSSIDEQMIPFTGKVPAKQVIKSKPNPEGVKVFVRCSPDGIAHDFEIYQGKGTGIDSSYAHLGLGGSVVLRLCEKLPKGRNFKCFFDNYFTSVNLLRELRTAGIQATGTIRGNRLMGCNLKNEKELRKEGRGAMDRKTTEEGDVVLVRWLDNGVVNIASTQVGCGTVGVASRWSDASKERIAIPCPEAILQYNKFMGGVDKLDFVMALYPMKAKTRKWPVRVICHFVSLALANSWLEYVRDASDQGIPRRKALDMLAFQTDVAISLVQVNKSAPRKRGRPSAESAEVPARRTHNSFPAPPNAVRYDGKDHWPQQLQLPFPQRCKYEKCPAKTRVRCRKCDVFLCIAAEKDCFFLYHNQ